MDVEPLACEDVVKGTCVTLLYFQKKKINK